MSHQSNPPALPPASDDRGDISLDWLIRLRWGAVGRAARDDRAPPRPSSAASRSPGSSPWSRSRPRATPSSLSAAVGRRAAPPLRRRPDARHAAPHRRCSTRAAGPPTRSASSTSCTSRSPRWCSARAGRGRSPRSRWFATGSSSRPAAAGALAHRARRARRSPSGHVGRLHRGRGPHRLLRGQALHGPRAPGRRDGRDAGARGAPRAARVRDDPGRGGRPRARHAARHHRGRRQRAGAGDPRAPEAPAPRPARGRAPDPLRARALPGDPRSAGRRLRPGRGEAPGRWRRGGVVAGSSAACPPRQPRRLRRGVPPAPRPERAARRARAGRRRTCCRTRSRRATGR